MKYMLDTNICIYIIKQKPQGVIDRFLMMQLGDVCISSITYAELMFGVEKSQAKARNLMALNLLMTGIEVVPFGGDAAQDYGIIRAALQRDGTPIGPLDMLIAAHAKSLGLTLVTNNIREFGRVEGLKLENWADNFLGKDNG